MNPYISKQDTAGVPTCRPPYIVALVYHDRLHHDLVLYDPIYNLVQYNQSQIDNLLLVNRIGSSAQLSTACIHAAVLYMIYSIVEGVARVSSQVYSLRPAYPGIISCITPTM